MFRRSRPSPSTSPQPVRLEAEDRITIDMSPVRVWTGLTEKTPDEPGVRIYVEPGTGPADCLQVGSVQVTETLTGTEVTSVLRTQVVVLDVAQRLLGMVILPTTASPFRSGLDYAVSPGRRGTILTVGVWVEVLVIDEARAFAGLNVLRGELDRLTAAIVPEMSRSVQAAARSVPEHPRSF